LEYFNTTIKAIKPSPRRVAIETNILSGLLGALAGMSLADLMRLDMKSEEGGDRGSVRLLFVDGFS
jgi:hypothetical protein